MTISTIARPYAKAAFEAAKASDQLPQWSLALKKLSVAVQDEKMKSVLKNPCYTKKQLAELLGTLVDDFLPIKNFIAILAEKKRLILLPEISILFIADCAKESGYLSLAVTSAFAMDDAQKDNVKEKLSKQLQSKLDIDFKIDEAVVGGLLIRSDNWVIDGTVKGALQRLKSALI